MKLRSSVAVALIAASSLAVATPGTASAAPGGRADEHRTIGGGVIAAASEAPGVARQEFLDNQARSGRLVDAQSIRSAQVDGESFVWENSSRIVSARVDVTNAGSESSSDAAVVVELGMQTEEVEGARRPTATTGLGMGSASVTGGTIVTNGCATWYSNSNKLTACYQKLKPTNDGSSTRDYYAYNRWGTAEGKVVSLNFDYSVTKIDLRSRPHSSYRTRVTGLSNYFPRDSTQLCNAGTSIGITLGSMGLAIGLTNCADKSPVVDANLKSMGIIYDDGVIFGGRVKGAEFEMEVYTSQNGATPVFADYNYAKFCQGTYATCNTVNNSGAGW